jgi:hypothetical protein
VEKVLEERFIESLPVHLIGDRAYDSDSLDEKLDTKRGGNDCPHRGNRKKKKTQDGRKLRRYQGRWKIERFFA